uniref:Cytochrome c oxidase subunit 3 n=1 Tax=Paratomella rubra TaxID=90914 RepID=A0A1X9WD80_PARRR|nr:cytochrome c oxidase subunit III [Paratomella rubra]ARS00883.1 cytochrome c oxidase subunit 3 [Paratomella rubra]
MYLKLHPFHMVDESPWPIYMSIAAFHLPASLLFSIFSYNYFFFFFGLIFIILVFMVWMRDSIRESTFQGMHTFKVMSGIRLGFIWFIVSEIFFFSAFFWGFFHSSFCLVPEIGVMWPPVGMDTLDTFSVPLLNTLVLLSSGVSLTWSHHEIMMGKMKSASFGLILTVFLGLYFTLLQMFEYYESSFTICDSIFGSIFFVATGFHGLHVIIGSTFLLVCFIRLKSNQFSSMHLVGVETASWYWHFVDVVWLFLFVCVYWWGF